VLSRPKQPLTPGPAAPPFPYVRPRAQLSEGADQLRVRGRGVLMAPRRNGWEAGRLRAMVGRPAARLPVLSFRTDLAASYCQRLVSDCAHPTVDGTARRRQWFGDRATANPVLQIWWSSATADIKASRRYLVRHLRRDIRQDHQPQTLAGPRAGCRPGTRTRAIRSPGSLTSQGQPGGGGET